MRLTAWFLAGFLAFNPGRVWSLGFAGTSAGSSSPDSLTVGSLAEPGEDIWLAISWKNSNMTMQTLTSGDGKNWAHVGSNLYAPSSGVFRDASWIYKNSIYYVAYPTSVVDSHSAVQIATSTNLSNWGRFGSISFGSISSVDRVFSPEFFEDEGTVWVSVSVSTDSGTTHRIWVASATSADLSSWGSPTMLTGTFPANYFDSNIIKENGVYYMFWKNETTKYIEYATSSALLSGWTQAGTGDWAGWGQNLEGPYLVKVDSDTWRLYMDAYIEQGMYYAENSFLVAGATTGWSGKFLCSAPYNFPHASFMRTNDIRVMRNILGMAVGRSAGWAKNGNYATYWNRVGIGTDAPTAQMDIWTDSFGQITRNLVLRNDANDNNTGVSIDFVPDITDTPLATMDVQRQSQATGVTNIDFATWNGSALDSRLLLTNNGVTIDAKTQAQLQTLDPDTAGQLVFNSTQNEFCRSTGTAVGSWVLLQSSGTQCDL